MLTESTLAELSTLITTSAAPDRRAELLSTLDDLQRTIAAQSLAIRNLTIELRNRRVAGEALDALLPASSLNLLLNNLGHPTPTPFSLSEAQSACQALADQAARTTTLADITTALIKVARAFL